MKGRGEGERKDPKKSRDRNPRDFSYRYIIDLASWRERKCMCENGFFFGEGSFL